MRYFITNNAVDSPTLEFFKEWGQGGLTSDIKQASTYTLEEALSIHMAFRGKVSIHEVYKFSDVVSSIAKPCTT